MASPARLSWQISIFPENTFLAKLKLWEIVFMGFLTHRNLPETLGGHIQKNEKFGFFDFFCMVGFFTFFKISGLLYQLSGPLLDQNLFKIPVLYKKLYRFHYSNPQNDFSKAPW